MTKILTLGELTQKFFSHLGGKGDAHQKADKLVAGFMSPEMFIKHDSLFNQREFITDDNGIDIFSLEPGYYNSNRFKNTPLSGQGVDQWLAYVNVTRGYSGAKTYTYFTSNKDDIYTCTSHYGNKLENGSMLWTQIQQKTLIWKGNSDLKSPITFKDDKVINRNGWLYQYFIIEGFDSFGQVFKVETKQSRSANADIIHINQDDNGIKFQELNFDFKDDNTLILKDNNIIDLKPSKIDDNETLLSEKNKIDRTISIRTIWGVR